MGKVKTVSGKSVERNKTRKISGKYYEENVDCFLIDGKWNRKDNGIIAYDLDLKSWRKIKSMVDENKIPLIIGKDDSGDLDIGYTSDRRERFIPLLDFTSTDGKTLYALDEDVAIQLGYEENINNSYFHKNAENSGYTGKIGSGEQYPFKLEYNLKDYGKGSLIAEATDFFMEVAAPNLVITDREEFMSKFLGTHTFGLEYETSKGFIPPRFMYRWGLMPLRDGSISGTEYVSIPLRGAQGLQAIKAHCEVLNKRTINNEYCSLHLHIGNIKKTPLFAVALYCLCYRLQEELHEMLPPFKRSVHFIKSKDKDHAQLLKSLDIVYNNGIIEPDTGNVTKTSLDTAFGRIWSFLTGGYEMNETFNPKTGRHPQEGRSKWHWFPRYHWVNFLNLYFGPGTIEFRCHHASSDFIQVSNWFFICIAIVRYSEQYPEQIISGDYKINLEEVLQGFITNFDTEDPSDDNRDVCNYLLSYVRNVKDIHTANYIANEVSFGSYVNSIEHLCKVDYKEMKELY